jgi:hypothetical protein
MESGTCQDFDGGVVGQTVVNGLTTAPNPTRVTWKAVNASEFPGGATQLVDAVLDYRTWVAIASCVVLPW